MIKNGQLTMHINIVQKKYEKECKDRYFLSNCNKNKLNSLKGTQRVTAKKNSNFM